jgi:hypothetical protein
MEAPLRGLEDYLGLLWEDYVGFLDYPGFLAVLSWISFGITVDFEEHRDFSEPTSGIPLDRRMSERTQRHTQNFSES